MCTGMFDKFISGLNTGRPLIIHNNYFYLLPVNFVLEIFRRFWELRHTALLWAGVAFIVYKLLSRRAAAKLRFRKMFCWLAFLSAVAGDYGGLCGGLLEGSVKPL